MSDEQQGDLPVDAAPAPAETETPAAPRKRRSRPHRSREQNAALVLNIIGQYPPGPAGLQAALAEVDKAFPGSLLTADGVISVTGVGEFGPRPMPGGTVQAERLDTPPEAAIEAARVPVRAPISLALPKDGVDPLAVIMAWVGEHGIPAVEQLAQLVSLAEHVAAIKARQAFTVAFAQLQHELEPVNPTATSPFGSYASLQDITAAVRQPLARNGFALSFRLNEQWVEQTGSIELTLTTVLAHVAGHSEACTMSLALEVGPISSRTGAPVRSIAQARAAALTAARRLAILSLLNLSVLENEQQETTQAAEPAVPEGAEDAVKALQGVDSRQALGTTWNALPYVLRRYVQANYPELLESLKAKFPAEPAAPAEPPATE